MELSFADAVGIVVPIVGRMSEKPDVVLSEPLRAVGIRSAEALDVLVARIDRELRDAGYRLATPLLRANLSVETTVDALAHSVARLASRDVEAQRADRAEWPSRGSRRPEVAPEVLPPAPPQRQPPPPEIDVPTTAAPEPPPTDATPPPPYFTVPVFYGTTRARTVGSHFYGTERGPLRYGRAMVSVPSERRIGDIPRPSIWTLYREDPSKHYLLREVEERSADEFVAEAKRHMASGGANEAFVFVHGFNVIYADAVYRTAQIAADLNFGGAAMLFTWPSKGKLSPRGYTMDETEAEWTAPYLAAFLQSVAGMGAEKVHLIAHSMGNRVLTGALRRLREVDLAPPGAFRELVLTAPDIDTETFVNDIAPAIRPTANRVTLYASSRDVALAYSKRIHGYPRLGDSDENLVALDDIDTIDVSAVDTNLIGHFYYGDNRSVLSDLFNLIKGDRMPRFGLREKKKGARTYWVFQP